MEGIIVVLNSLAVIQNKSFRSPSITMMLQLQILLTQEDTSPSSIFSFAQDCPLRSVTERSAIELNLEPPRYLEELVVPFPATVVVLVFALAPASPASLVLRRGPESENSLPEI